MAKRKLYKVGMNFCMEMLPNETLDEAHERFELLTTRMDSFDEENLENMSEESFTLNIDNVGPIVVEEDYWQKFITEKDAIGLCKMLVECVTKSGNYTPQELTNINALLEEKFVLADVLDDVFINISEFVEWKAQNKLNYNDLQE